MLDGGEMAKAKTAGQSTPEYKIGSLYNLAMDQEGRDRHSVEDYDSRLRPAMEAKTVAAFLDACAKLQKEFDMDGFLNTEIAEDEFGNTGKYVAILNDLNYVIDPEEFKERDLEAENKTYFFDGYLKKHFLSAGRPKEEAKEATDQAYRRWRKPTGRWWKIT